MLTINLTGSLFLLPLSSYFPESEEEEEVSLKLTLSYSINTGGLFEDLKTD